jgi:hypothetical protein
MSDEGTGLTLYEDSGIIPTNSILIVQSHQNIHSNQYTKFKQKEDKPCWSKEGKCRGNKSYGTANVNHDLSCIGKWNRALTNVPKFEATLLQLINTLKMI